MSANYIAKFDLTTGILDTNFSPPASNGFDNLVATLITAGSSLYVGGSFTSYRGISNSANHLAKLDLTTGAIDTTFSPIGTTANGFNGNVNSMVTSSTNLYVGGGFSAYKGVANSAIYLAKLDLTTGDIDTTFSPVGVATNGFNGGGFGLVFTLATANTSLYVGGFFSDYRGVATSANNLAKLDLTTGTIDTTFSPVGASSNGFPYGSLVMNLRIANSSLYAGGSFNSYRGVSYSANNLAKLNLTSGAIDTTFSPVGVSSNGFNSSVNFLTPVTTSDGTELYVGGSFSAYRGTQPAYFLVPLDLTNGDLLDPY